MEKETAVPPRVGRDLLCHGLRVLVGRLPGRARPYNCWGECLPYYIVQRLVTQIRIPLPKKTQVTDSKVTKVSSE